MRLGWQLLLGKSKRATHPTMVPSISPPAVLATACYAAIVRPQESPSISSRTSTEASAFNPARMETQSVFFSPISAKPWANLHVAPSLHDIGSWSQCLQSLEGFRRFANRCLFATSSPLVRSSGQWANVHDAPLVQDEFEKNMHILVGRNPFVLKLLWRWRRISPSQSSTSPGPCMARTPEKAGLSENGYG